MRGLGRDVRQSILDERRIGVVQGEDEVELRIENVLYCKSERHSYCSRVLIPDRRAQHH